MPDVDITFESDFEQVIEPVVTEVGITFGDLYIPTNDQSSLTGAINRSDFTLTTGGQTVFNVNQEARQLMHVMVNGLDYVQWCKLNIEDLPGQVLYTRPSGGYETEEGDSVIIYWTR